MSETPKMTLKDWKKLNAPGKEMNFELGYWRQINFMQHEITFLMMDYNEYDKMEYLSDERYDFIHSFINVLSTHISKSIKLPVYEFKSKGIRFIVRYNFHDWKVSIISDRDLEIEPKGLFNPKSSSVKPCYFEGFPKDLVFPNYNEKENKDKFSVCLHNEFSMYVFFWYLINKVL